MVSRAWYWLLFVVHDVLVHWENAMSVFLGVLLVLKEDNSNATFFALAACAVVCTKVGTVTAEHAGWALDEVVDRINNAGFVYAGGPCGTVTVDMRVFVDARRRCAAAAAHVACVAFSAAALRHTAGLAYIVFAALLASGCTRVCEQAATLALVRCQPHGLMQFCAYNAAYNGKYTLAVAYRVCAGAPFKITVARLPELYAEQLTFYSADDREFFVDDPCSYFTGVPAGSVRRPQEFGVVTTTTIAAQCVATAAEPRRDRRSQRRRQLQQQQQQQQQ